MVPSIIKFGTKMVVPFKSVYVGYVTVLSEQKMIVRLL